MAGLSPFAMVHSLDQWRRVAHENTALEQIGENHGQVQLSWLLDERIDEGNETCTQAAGMAFDPWCRIYRALPEKGQIERSLWAAEGLRDAESIALFTTEVTRLGEFATPGSESSDTVPQSETFSQTADEDGRFEVLNYRGDGSGHGPLRQPLDVVVDNQGRLFIAEAGRQRVLIYDLIENKLLHQIAFKQAPTRLASDGSRVWVLLSGIDPALAILEGRSPSRIEALPVAITQPTAIAVNNGEVYLLDQGGSAEAAIFALTDPVNPIQIAYASDMVFVDEHILVVARRSAEDFLRFEINRDGRSELPHMKARHYDGRGIVMTPDGHVAYWSDTGLRRATLARVRYQTHGRITSFRLDSREFQTQWGRLFIDACIPRGTRVTVRCLCLDEVPETAALLPHTLPDNVLEISILPSDLASMPPEKLISNLGGEAQNFYRRHNGREIPWQPCATDTAFQTYEAPVIAPAGRYLWLQVELHGTARLTPKIKSLRAEYPAHDLLQRLPQVYSREPVVADFLRRYLAIAEGELRELDMRASYRHLLLDPQATPAGLLPWLGEFLGMSVDKRWSERAKRELIADATWLFRYRGTVMGLKRFIEIYLDSTVTIIEHFKVRGLGGALLGEADALTSNSILGAGFRIGGKLGEQETDSINDVSIQDAMTTHAHRFSLIVAVSLSDEQRAVIGHLLDSHRPAHTIYDICSVDNGMHLGIGLHAGLTSIVGETSGFGELQLGASILGHADTVGTAAMGTDVGNSRLGDDSRAG